MSHRSLLEACPAPCTGTWTSRWDKEESVKRAIDGEKTRTSFHYILDRDLHLHQIWAISVGRWESEDRKEGLFINCEGKNGLNCFYYLREVLAAGERKHKNTICFSPQENELVPAG